MPKSPVFLIITRLLREKGVVEFCEAARRAHKQYPEARFQIGGFFDEHPGELTMSDPVSYTHLAPANARKNPAQSVLYPIILPPSQRTVLTAP